MNIRTLTVHVDHNDHDLAHNIITTTLTSYGIEHRVICDDWDGDDEEEEETP